jgi:two-component system chemotaxis response regulator CheV
MSAGFQPGTESRVKQAVITDYQSAGVRGNQGMTGLLESVNQRTQLAGQNRLELLLFRINNKQRYGINVFKVREVIVSPPMQQLPHSHPDVRGVIRVRGKTIPVIDLAKVLGLSQPQDTSDMYIIITEFNRSVQGFLVCAVDRILNMNWDAIKPPPRVGNNFLTAVTQVDDELVEIIDVEKVLATVTGMATEVSSDIAMANSELRAHLPLLVVDDSGTARSMIKRTLEQIGFSCMTANSGKEGLGLLQTMAGEGLPMTDRISLVISDIEMPEMDGYTLTAEIKKDPRLAGLRVVLHSSMSGGFNDALARKVGADLFLPKFHPDELARVVLENLRGMPAALPKP